MLLASRLLVVGVFCIFSFGNADVGDDVASNKTCSSLSGSGCEVCVTDPACYFCHSDSKCYHYKWSSVHTWFEHCSWGDARWKHCWLNVEALVISCSVIGGILLIVLCCFCCYFNRLCNRRKLRRHAQEMNQMEREDSARVERQDERRKEREDRRDAIRQKYGLQKKAPYKTLNEEDT